MSELLDMAEELDGMERSVTTWEAGFLESVLELLREDIRISPKQESKLKAMHDQYLGPYADEPKDDDDDDVFA